MVSLTILDVGHGNCAVLRDDQGAVVIDGGSRQTLLRFLQDTGINEVDMVLVSHADADHISGIIELLLDPCVHVRKLYVNPDAMRRTDTWEDFRSALAERMASSDTEVTAQLTTQCSDEFSRTDVKIEVLAPTPITALGAVGGQDLNGATITANSMSAVIRVSAETGTQVLLAGDMDATSLEEMTSREVQLNAHVMVYPHHGGQAGTTDIPSFVGRLCELVDPSLVIFSVGRGGTDNPQPDIVAAVLDALPNAYVACTQLCRTCAAELPALRPTHIGDRIARGAANNQCCAGTLEITLDSDELRWTPLAEEHLGFVAEFAPDALCRRSAST